MENKKLKVAFLGGGINSAVGRTHKIAIEMDNKFELVTGCFSRNKEINMKTALEFGVNADRVYSNLDELIEKEKDNIDAICILTPTPNHKEEVIKCLKNGIKVICEKSLAVSVREVLEIKEVLEKQKGFLVVTYNYTGYPVLRELKYMIKNGMLGKIHQVNIEMPQESFIKVDKFNNPIKPQDWRLKDRDIPTLSLDLGVHLHAILNFLLGEKPLEVVSVQNSFGHFKNVIDNDITIAKYTNDIIVSIWYSKSALGHRNGLKVRVYGELGSAEWYQMEPEYLYFNDNKGHRFIIDRASVDVNILTEERYNRFKAGHPAGFIEAFANYYYDIANYIISGKNNGYVFGIEEALEGLKMLEAMHISALKKEWVKI